MFLGRYAFYEMKPPTNRELLREIRINRKLIFHLKAEVSSFPATLLALLGRIGDISPQELDLYLRSYLQDAAKLRAQFAEHDVSEREISEAGE